MMRLDKLLAHSGYGSRKEVKGLIKQKIVSIDGVIATSPAQIVNPDKMVIKVGDDEVSYEQFVYYIMNKPEGIISATEDHYYDTVIDWMGESYYYLQLFPVGRLDIDTTGLLLLTNDGKMAHRLLSPKSKVNKRYFALVSGKIQQEAIEKFKSGLNLGDFTTLPATLEVLFYDDTQNVSHVEVVICEGKFHQVKRMFEAVGSQVLRLHRLAMGDLVLPDDLAIGDFRKLTQEELMQLHQTIKGG